MPKCAASKANIGYSFTLAILTMMLAVLGGYRYAWRWEDAYWYTMMATGQTAHVMAPFTSRPLTPLIVRGIAFISGITIHHAFFMFGIFCIVLLVSLLVWILSSQNVAPQMLWIVVLVSFWPLTFENYILPDLLNAALLGVLIFLMLKERYFYASLMLFPLALSRESVLVILACFLVVGWRRLRWTQVTTAIGSTVSGIALVKFLSRNSVVNRHHLGFVAYMAGKIPWNFSANILGLTLWSNDLQTFCSAPQWSHSLPIHFGRISAIGYCGYNPVLQLKTICAVLCLFGIFPLLFVILWARGRFDLWPTDVALRFCLLYGFVCILLAPLLGSATDRLVSYSWPLFLLAVPIQASETLALSGINGSLLIVVSGIISWVGFVLEQSSTASAMAIFLVLLVLPGYIYTWKVARSLCKPSMQEPHPAVE